MNAAKVRQEKEAHPERFCPDKRCLWRVQRMGGDWPCPKHMAQRGSVPASQEPQ